MVLARLAPGLYVRVYPTPGITMKLLPVIIQGTYTITLHSDTYHAPFV